MSCGCNNTGEMTARFEATFEESMHESGGSMPLDVALYSIIACEYEETAYSIGDYCIKDRKLYHCITEIAPPGEEWNSDHWEQVTTSSEILSLATALSNISSDLREIDAEISGNNAEPYDNTQTYAVGDYCIANGYKLYRCTTAVETPGDWDSDYWTLVNLSSELKALNQLLDSRTVRISDEESNGNVIIRFGV